jgi:hypothetical protein
MKVYALLLLVILCVTRSSAQTTSDSIIIKKSFGVSQFYQHDKKVSFHNLVKTMKSDEQAYAEIRKAEYTHFMVRGLNNAGTIFILLPLIALAIDEEPAWYLAGIGAGLLVINIPFTRKFNKQVTLAVNTYNEGVKTTSYPDKTNIDLTFNGSGIGLQFRF